MQKHIKEMIFRCISCVVLLAPPYSYGAMGWAVNSKWIKNLSQSIPFCRVHLPFAIPQISCSNSDCWSTAPEMAFSYRDVPVTFDRGTPLHKALQLVFQWQVPVVEWLNQALRRIHVLMNASHPLSGSLYYSRTLADSIAWERSTTILISDCLCL